MPWVRLSKWRHIRAREERVEALMITVPSSARPRPE
jgi:hypothetical protein